MLVWFWARFEECECGAAAQFRFYGTWSVGPSLTRPICFWSAHQNPINVNRGKYWCQKYINSIAWQASKLKGSKAKWSWKHSQTRHLIPRTTFPFVMFSTRIGALPSSPCQVPTHRNARPNCAAYSRVCSCLRASKDTELLESLSRCSVCWLLLSKCCSKLTGQ